MPFLSYWASRTPRSGRSSCNACTKTRPGTFAPFALLKSKRCRVRRQGTDTGGTPGPPGFIRRFSVQELAADAWDAAELPDLTPLAEWLSKRPDCTSAVNVPEERHRYGQHFTGDDVVDLINAFCVRDGADTVLDPACESGTLRRVEAVR